MYSLIKDSSKSPLKNAQGILVLSFIDVAHAYISQLFLHCVGMILHFVTFSTDECYLGERETAIE